LEPGARLRLHPRLRLQAALDAFFASSPAASITGGGSKYLAAVIAAITIDPLSIVDGWLFMFDLDRLMRPAERVVEILFHVRQIHAILRTPRDRAIDGSDRGQIQDPPFPDRPGRESGPCGKTLLLGIGFHQLDQARVAIGEAQVFEWSPRQSGRSLRSPPYSGAMLPTGGPVRDAQRN